MYSNLWRLLTAGVNVKKIIQKIIWSCTGCDLYCHSRTTTLIPACNSNFKLYPINSTCIVSHNIHLYLLRLACIACNIPVYA